MPDLLGDTNGRSRGLAGRLCDGSLVAAISLVAVLGASVVLAANLRPAQPTGLRPVAAALPAAFDATRLMLNALLVPALDGDAVPLRWTDPRPASRCEPGSTVRVNQKPLVAGALVPNAPFELEWQADGCRPFGISGPRFDGRVRLLVFREDWGLSAMVEPQGLRIGFAGHQITFTQSFGAWLPFVDDNPEPLSPTQLGQAA